jgi:uncharacterized membrane protein YkoI
MINILRGPVSLALAGFALALTFAANVRAAETFKGHELKSSAKISLAEARKIALVARKGKLSDEELEREPGGSGLRYSFDIKDGKIMYEVGVDAATGEILENAAEGANPD